MTSNFPFCQLVVLDRRRLPLNFPRLAAGGLLADTFMQPGNLCVPKTSSTSRDQAVFVDQATDAGLPSDAVPVEIDRFG